MAVPQPEQADAVAAAEARQQAAFPPPPPYFRLFRDTAAAASPAADGSSGSNVQPLQPPPLPDAPDATFQLFGELHTAQPGIPPLAVRQMYDTQPDGSIDFRAELRRLNRELLFAFAKMLAAISERPSQSARSVELVGILARNLQHLLNLLRPHQAAATLEHLLRQELKDQREAIADLRQRQEEAHQLVASAAEELVALGQTSGSPGPERGIGIAAMEIDTVANGPVQR